MNLYRVTLNVSNSRANIPARTVRLDVTGQTPTDALSRIDTVWTSRDGREANTTGVRFGYAYPEFVLSGKARKVGTVDTSAA